MAKVLSEQYSLTVYKDWKFSPALAEPAAPSVTDRIRLIVESLPGNHAKWVEGDDLSFEEVQARLKTWTIHLLQELAAAPSSVQAQELNNNRCAICGWPLVEGDGLNPLGCVRGNCSMRPFPAKFYDYDRANLEYKRVFDISARASSPSSATDQPANDWKFFGNKIRQFRKAIINGGTDSHAADRIVQILHDTVSAPTEDK